MNTKEKLSEVKSQASDKAIEVADRLYKSMDGLNSGDALDVVNLLKLYIKTKAVVTT